MRLCTVRHKCIFVPRLITPPPPPLQPPSPSPAMLHHLAEGWSPDGPDQQVILRTILPIGIIETEKVLVPKKHKGLIAYAQPQSLSVSDEDRDRPGVRSLLSVPSARSQAEERPGPE